MTEKLSIPHHIAEEAVEWHLAVLAGEANQDELNSWLSRDINHQQAWTHIQNTNKRLKALKDPLARAAVLAPEDKSRRKAIKSLALLFFAGSGFTVLYNEYPWREMVADASTGAGERREIKLVDGSRINLNSSTAVNIDQSSSQIHISLIAGEILITTSTSKPLNSQPLTVQTKQGQFQPLGTRFTVQQNDHQTDVAVFSGRVAAYLSSMNLSKVKQSPFGVLEQGRQGSVINNQLINVKPVDKNSLAWLDGMLVAASMPLGEFISTLSMHRKGYLGCDPDIADMLVSGTYPLNDTDLILNSLQQSLPVKVQRLTQHWVRVVAVK